MQLCIFEINGEIRRADFQSVKEGSDVTLFDVLWRGGLGFDIDETPFHERDDVKVPSAKEK